MFFVFKPHIKKHLGANAMKMMTFSPPPLWELRNFIRIFGEPASSTDICFIQIQLTIGLTKLLKAWRRFQGFYSVMLLWWQWMVVVVGGGNGWQLWLWYLFALDLGDALYTLMSSENQINHGSFSPRSRSPSIQMFTEQRDLRENQQFLKARDISGISEQTHILKKNNSSLRICRQPWNPEKSRSILDKILRVCDIGLPNSSTKKHAKIRHWKPLPMADPIRITPSPRQSLQKLWCSYWKF